MSVIVSKQRPRKISLHGDDGVEYNFLLKGHEDLRQDERVMQLFGLVNSLLASEQATGAVHLSVHTYSVVPLSPNSGIISWVANCDTLNALVQEYRAPRGIPHRLLSRLPPLLPAPLPGRIRSRLPCPMGAQSSPRVRRPELW